jgi:hypothetical protein
MLAPMSAEQLYRIVVAGELGARYASAFEGMTVCSHDGVTEMTGVIVDPAHLQALLKRIAGLGLTLRSLIRVDTGNLETGQPEMDLDTTSKGP